MSKKATQPKKSMFTGIAVLTAMFLVAAASCPALGWDTINIPNQDNLIGTWDATNRVFTLTTNVTASLVIVESDLTLEGAGFTVDGTTAPASINGIKIKDTISGVTVQNVTVLGFTYGIYLFNCTDNTVSNNTVNDSYVTIYSSGSLYNTITGNTLINANVGLQFSYSNENTVMNNTISDNNYGVYFSSSTNNVIYNNNFVSNNTQVGGASGNVFSLAAPTGGNHWSNWTSPDADADGFVDTPYVFSAGTDALPFVEVNGWVPEIEVAPVDYDFGNVEINDSRAIVVTITNVAKGQLEITSLAFTAASSSDFAITGSPTLPIILGPAATADIQVTYAPTSQGLAEATLEIASNDTDEPLVVVTLVGAGEITELPPAQQIANIRAFYEQSVAAGTLVGNGPNPRAAERRLAAMGCMLKAASDLISLGFDEIAACLLTQISYRCDGQPIPPDFATGEAAPQLHSMIVDLIADLQE